MNGWDRDNDRRTAQRSQRNQAATASRKSGDERDALQRDQRRQQLQERAEYVARNREAINQQLKDHFASHSNYTQLILLLGYGGFFTLWLQARGMMSLFLFGWTGACLSLSLLLFIGWELVKGFVGSIQISRLVAGETTLEDYDATIDKVNTAWPWVYGATTSIGLAGGIPLVCWFVYTTIRAASALPVVLSGPAGT